MMYGTRTRRTGRSATLAIGLSTASAAAIGLSASAAATVPDSDATRIVETVNGEVEVPTDPQRVVALDPFGTLQNLDQFGAPLVAAGSLAGDVRMFVSEDAEQLPSVGVGTELNLEAIAAADPDFIVGLESYGEHYDVLQDIAPTVLVPRDDWRQVVVDVTDAVGRRADAEAALAELDARVEAMSAEVAAMDEPPSVSVLRIHPDGTIRSYTTHLRNLSSSAILADIGVTVTGDGLGDDETVSYVEVSLENLADVDADVIVYYGGGGVLEANDALESLTASPVWNTLDAVTAGRALQVDADLWFSAADPESVGLLLDDIERTILGHDDATTSTAP